MTRMTLQQWATNLETDHEVGATQYNQSWAMVYFLVNAKDEIGRDRYRARLLRMMELLHDNKPADDAFTETFGGNLKSFQERFIEFAQDLKATPEATVMENQNVLADLLTELDGRGRRFDSVAAFRTVAVKNRYRLHYTRGQLNWTTDPNALVYFADAGGKPFDRDSLFFFPRASAPIPDIVCRFDDSTTFRTRFYSLPGGKVEHEVVVEGVNKLAGAN
jgi:hypothetical protein